MRLSACSLYKPAHTAPYSVVILSAPQDSPHIYPHSICINMSIILT